jgi:hypothetical protein
MTEYFFSVARGGEYNGKHIIDADVTTLLNGNLIALNSSGEIILDTGAANVVRGMLFEQRPRTEFVQDDNVASTHAGKYANFVTGAFSAFVAAGHFSSGSMPSVGDKLYPATSGSVGKLATSSAVTGQRVLGEVELITTVPDGVGGTYSVALCRFNFEPFVII